LKRLKEISGKKQIIKRRKKMVPVGLEPATPKKIAVKAGLLSDMNTLQKGQSVYLVHYVNLYFSHFINNLENVCTM